jgi:lipoprotein Spr
MNTTYKQYFAKSIMGLSLSVALIVSGSTLLTPRPAYAAAISASSTASEIITTGKHFIGVPYKFGAKSGITNSFDCSSLMQYIFEQHGITLPRSSKQQLQQGNYVSRSDLQPGDLVFFYSPVHHVAVYIGNGKILHTYGAPGVTISDLNSGWWDNHYTTARRVLPTSGQAVPTPTTKPTPTTEPTPITIPTPITEPTPTPVVKPTPTPGNNYSNLPWYYNFSF